MWGLEYKTFLHHYFLILPKSQCNNGGWGEGDKRDIGRGETGEMYQVPLEKINTKRIIRENYFLLSQYLLRQPYSKWAQFSADKKNTVRADPMLLWPSHKIDRKFQCDCLVFLFLISGICRSRVSTERRRQKLSTVALTAEEKKIQVPKPKLCGMMQFMICQLFF